MYKQMIKPILHYQVCMLDVECIVHLLTNDRFSYLHTIFITLVILYYIYMYHVIKRYIKYSFLKKKQMMWVIEKTDLLIYDPCFCFVCM